MVKTNLAYATNRPLDVRRDFGGIGNGTSRPLSTDFGTLADAQKYYPAAVALTDETDWAALQSLIDESIAPGAVSTTRQALRPMRAPVGVWVLNRPLTIASVQDPSFHGEGEKTIFKLGAVGLASMLDLNGVSHGSFRDFMFEGAVDPNTHTCTRTLWLRWGTGIGRSTNFNKFYNITVRGLHYTKAGFEIGDPGNAGVQVDSDDWFGCTTNGDTRWHEAGDTSEDAVGFHVGDGTYGNNLLHSFYGCWAVRNKCGLYVDATSATWDGGAIQAMHDADILSTSATYIAVGGYRSETSAALLKQPSGGIVPATARLYDIRFEGNQLAADGRVIDWVTGGSLIMQNVVVTNHIPRPATITMRSNGPVALELSGVAVGNRTLAEVLDVNQYTSVSVNSYMNVDDDGVMSGIESSTSSWVNPRTTLLEGAVAWWEAVDSDGSAWNDRITAAAMPLTNCTKVEGGNLYDTDKTAPADLVYFNGTSSFGLIPSVAYANQPGDIGGSDVSVALWGTFYVPGANDRYMWNTQNGGTGQLIVLRPSGYAQFYSWGSTVINSTGTTRLYAGRSTLVLTVGQAEVALFVNSVKDASISRAGDHDATVTGVSDKWVGKSSGTTAWAKAGLEGVAVFDRVLSSGEIASLLK